MTNKRCSTGTQHKTPLWQRNKQQTSNTYLIGNKTHTEKQGPYTNNVTQRTSSCAK